MLPCAAASHWSLARHTLRTVVLPCLRGFRPGTLAGQASMHTAGSAGEEVGVAIAFGSNLVRNQFRLLGLIHGIIQQAQLALLLLTGRLCSQHTTSPSATAWSRYQGQQASLRCAAKSKITLA